MALMSAGSLSAPAGTDVPSLKKTPDGRPLSLVFCDHFQTLQSWNGQSGIWRTAFGDGSQLGFDRSRPNSGELDPDLENTAGGLNALSLGKAMLEVGTPAIVKPNVGNYPYVSGLITTQPSFAQTYGYFEMRAELPQGKGLWPAFWMLPQDQSWPPEIDIVESIGDPSHVYMSAHSEIAGTAGVEAHITPRTFHIFAVSWDPRELIWYIDGVEAGRMPTPGDMHKPMYLLANLAVGGNWTRAPDTSERSPAKLMIDYIRAYKFDV